jgi:chromate transporter
LGKRKGIGLYWKLFRATFMLSAFTFGGGYVIVPLMQKRFVEDYKWIEEQEMMDLVAIARSAPGMIAVNASIMVGYRLAGVIGAFFAVVGTVLPPLIIITIISYFYQVFRDSPAVAAVLKGMGSGVAAVVVDAILTMGKNILKEKSIFSVGVMIVSFLVVFFFDIVVKIILGVSAVLGIAQVFYTRSKEKSERGAGV